MNTRSNTTLPHPSLAVLHELFDGQPVDAATARHARDCSSCANQMQTLTNQRRALGRLARRDANWMTAAQRQGRAVLGDLLAELAGACKARREAGQRSSPLSELPRPIERITADIRTLVTRLSRLPATTTARTITTTPTASATTSALRKRPAPGARLAPPDWRDLEALAQRAPNDAGLMTHCVSALRALEGDSSRWRALARA